MAARRSLTADVEQGLDQAERLRADAEIARLRARLSATEGRYKAALHEADRQRERADAMAGLAGVKAKPMPRKTRPARANSATAVVVLSDWHVEETVTAEQTSGLNRFDLEVADRRIAELAKRLGVLIEHERQLAKIDRIVVAALGDFISGHIHEELVETCSLAPMAAARWASARLRGMVDMVADLAREVIVVTQPGNHGRSNHGKPRKATEHEHSFEQNAYLIMAAQESRPNVQWQVAEGYLHYLDLDGFTIRSHHGHEIRYQGGVGGITIPVNKAIAAWNRSRPAHLDLFGHWHQWGWIRGRYVSNGSLIGLNAFALRIKAEYEPPCQSLVVIDHGRREVTRAMPVFCDGDLRDGGDAC
ncbi:MAG: hypothetical protein EBZ59_08955 [Planctomycetia bacterium]|nr:hypothetical protein [Planctomycetia bacterium]